MYRIILLASIFALACNNSHQSDTSVSENTTTIENASVYSYEPALSTLKGTLTAQVFWGPPNYGEDTTTDEKEKEYVLVLDKSIRMQKPDSDISEGYNGALNNVIKIQIVHQQKLQSYLNKTVHVTGTLFGAQTGHHHTEVLMDLKSIK